MNFNVAFSRILVLFFHPPYKSLWCRMFDLNAYYSVSHSVMTKHLETSVKLAKLGFCALHKIIKISKIKHIILYLNILCVPHRDTNSVYVLI